jgi:trigger factor
VVEHETEQLLQEYAQSLARQGVDLERAKLDWQKLAEEARPQAERRVHERLLLDAVAEARSVTVDEEEFQKKLALIAKAQGRSIVALRESLSETGKLSQLREQMRREKSLQYLLGENKVPG